MSTVALFLRLARVQVRGQMQYRTSFLLSLSGTFLFTALDFAAILILFQNVSAIAGWTASDVALLYAASALSFALTDIVLGSLDRLPVMIRDGTLDTLMIRPRSTFFQVLSTDFMFRRAGRLIQAVAVLIVVTVAFPSVGWNPARVAVLGLAIISGAVIMSSVWVVAASVCFWVDGANEFVNSFTSGAAFLAQYPLDVYGDWLRKLVLFVIPIGFVIYLPLSWVLGKPDVSGLPEVLRFASPAVAALTALVASVVWRRSIMRYRSAGG